MCDYLQLVIQEHHYLCIENSHLKPKFRLATHYPKIIKEISPISNIISIRFESFHKFFKDISKVSKCKKDLLKDLSIKYQLKFAGYLQERFFQRIRNK